MTMTLAVYRLDRQGNRHVVRKEHEVTPLKRPEFSSAWPPCRCPRHRDSNRP